jgi:hypothetical protein
MPATRRATHDATNLLTATPDEAAILIAAALGSAIDLLRLAAACRRFALKCIAAPRAPRGASSSAAAAAAQELEMWSIAEEAARRWIADCNEQERNWVPRHGRESWLGLMWEVEVLGKDLVFGRSHVEITLSEGGAVATMSDAGHGVWPTTASKAVMRMGRHYAQFTVVSGELTSFGVIRPGWDVEVGSRADNVDGHCFYYMGDATDRTPNPYAEPPPPTSDPASSPGRGAAPSRAPGRCSRRSIGGPPPRRWTTSLAAALLLRRRWKQHREAPAVRRCT